MSTEIKVTGVEAISAPIKSDNVSVRYAPWLVRVRYTLEDGSTLEGTSRSKLKRDALPGVVSLDGYAKQGAVSASFNSNGEFWGIVTKLTLSLGRGGGLVPQSA